jgi:hypothetical protein
MFESVSRGFGFLGQALDMARKDMDLVKPSLYGVVVGTVVSTVCAVPIGVVAFLGGDSELTRAVLYVMGAVLLFIQYTVAYIFSGMTAYLVYGYVAEGDGRMDKAWAMLQRNWLNLLSLAGVSALVKLVTNALRGDRRNRNALGGFVAGLIDQVWTVATYFVLPAMVIEDLNLVQAVKRATYIIKNNFLLVAVSEIGVGLVMGLIGFVATLGVLGIAGAAFFVLINLHFIVGLLVAVLVCSVGFTLISAANSYVQTAYHTCMFLWARSAEKAVTAGNPARTAPIPAPLANLLGNALPS